MKYVPSIGELYYESRIEENRIFIYMFELERYTSL